MQQFVAMDYEAFTRNLKEELRTTGKISSGPMAGRPLMVLTTRGARSGEPREAVVTYTRDGDRYVIAASKSGAPTNPHWYHNLLANPDATVEAGGEKFTATATEAAGAEYERLWNQHAEQRPEFQEYPKKTSRRIPVFTLQRTG
jgi:deazaflavin-dependent oxidoreductase (nitroreductase family)